MNFSTFTSNLKRELEKPLPGRDVQLAMSSIKRIRELFKFSNENKAVKSSVLILLYPGPSKDSIRLVLILRPTYDGIHSGQISLPGGKYEISDKDLRQTALRETKEEIGIDIHSVTVIGKLSPLYIPPSNFLVQPYVGFTSSAPEFSPDSKEVEKIIEIFLSDFLNDKNIRKKHILLRGGISIFAPCYIIDGNTIWGATAMILNEFREIVKRTGL
jgi:8-oxo-dGTP pyrophosphatase MutT (NUDIX family)